MTISQVQQIKQTQQHDELILVVKRSHLFPNGDWHGLAKINFDHYMHIIDHKKEFHPRSLMETNTTYKQIIPYLVFQHNNKYFLMQRKADASETRLRSKLTLGIGGHVRQEDLQEKSLYAWAMREFHEEVHYAGNSTVQPLGILNDDSNEVGKVHIGFVFLVTGDSPNISVKSELKNGTLVSLQECIEQKNYMETWSQFAVDFLAHQQKGN